MLEAAGVLQAPIGFRSPVLCGLQNFLCSNLRLSGSKPDEPIKRHSTALSFTTQKQESQAKHHEGRDFRPKCIRIYSRHRNKIRKSRKYLKIDIVYAPTKMQALPLRVPALKTSGAMSQNQAGVRVAPAICPECIVDSRGQQWPVVLRCAT